MGAAELIPPPPPGFALDAAVPQPPAGFTLDAASVAPRNPKASDYLKAFGTDAMKAYADTGLNLGLAAAAPAVIADRLRSVFTGNFDTSAGDAAFGALVDPVRGAQEHWAPDPNRTFGEKAAGMGGTLASVLQQIFATPGSGPAFAQRMMPMGVESAVQGAIKAQPTFAQPGGSTRALDLTDRGVNAETARQAGAATALTNTAMAALPASLAGKILPRIGTGAAIGAATSVPATGIQNVILGDYPKEQQDPFDLENLALQSLAGGAFGWALGKPRPTIDRAPVPDQPPGLDFAPPEVVEAPIQSPVNYDPQAQIKAVMDALYPAPESAPEGMGLVPKQGGARPSRVLTPEVMEGNAPAMEIARALDSPLEAPDGGGRTQYRDVEQHLDSRTAFDTARAQALRKQEAQDEAALMGEDPRNLSEARAGGTTTKEGTAALAPETFTFFRPVVKGGDMVSGERVERVGEPFAADSPDGKKKVEVQQVRFPDRDGAPEMPVPTKDLKDMARPQSPRFAQAIRDVIYPPQKGVGTGPDQPAPRAAAQRITTGESPEFIPADKAKGPTGLPREYVGRFMNHPPQEGAAPNAPQVGSLKIDLSPKREGGDGVVQGEGVVREQRPDLQVGRPQADSGGSVQQAKAEPASPRDAYELWNSADARFASERDLLDFVENYDGKVSPRLRAAAEAYRKAVDEDFGEYAGRGDVEPHQDAFMEALRGHAEAPAPVDAATLAQRRRLQAGLPAENPNRVGMPLNEWIAKNGGLDSGEKLDTVGDTRVQRKQGWDQFGVGKWLFHKNGTKIDELAQRAHREGYLTDAEFNDVDGGVQALRDKIADGYGRQGREHLALGDEEAVLRAEQEGRDRHNMEMAKEEANRLGMTDPDDPRKGDLISRATDIDPDAVERAAIKAGEDELKFMREVERIVDDHESRAEPTPVREADRGTAPEGERPALTLESPTAGKLNADAAAARKAEAERVAREKAPPPEDFGLVGGKTDVDKARAQGQEELAQPKGDGSGLSRTEEITYRVLQQQAREGALSPSEQANLYALSKKASDDLKARVDAVERDNPRAPAGTWEDSGEGPWKTEKAAREFADAEVGAEHRIVQRGAKTWAIEVKSDSIAPPKPETPKAEQIRNGTGLDAERQRIADGTKRVGDTAPQRAERAAPDEPSASGIEKAREVRRQAALDEPMSKDGEIKTRRQIVDDMIADGAVVVPHQKDGRRLQRPNGAYIEEGRLTKTAMDYAEQQLSAQKPEAPKAEEAKAPPKAPQDPDERVVGATYQTPKGPMEWRGHGWKPPGEAEVQPGTPRAGDKASPLHDPVSDLVKAQAAALNIGKGRTYDSALQRAKEIMRGEREATTGDARWFEKKGAEMKASKMASEAMNKVAAEVRKMAKADAGRLSSNPFDLVLKPVAAALKRMFVPDKSDLAYKVGDSFKDMIDGLKSGDKRKKAAAAERALGFLFMGDASMMDTVGRTIGSKVLQRVARLFHDFGGIHEAVGETAEAQYTRHARRFENDVTELIGPHIKGMNDAQIAAYGKQLRRQLETGNPQGEVAKRIQTMLKNELKNLKESGVEMGEIDNYFPRVYAALTIMKNPEAFRAAVVKAFLADHPGMKPADAKAGAEEWLARVRTGQTSPDLPFTQIGSSVPRANFAKERKISTKALFDSGLVDYLDNNPVSALQSYVIQTSKRALVERLFGGKEYLVSRNGTETWVSEKRPGDHVKDERSWLKYRELVDGLKDEGNEDMIPFMQHRIQSMLNQSVTSPNRAAMAWIAVGRGLTVAEFLQRTAVLQLLEPLQTFNRTAAMGLDKAFVNTLKAYGDTASGLFEAMKIFQRSDDREDQYRAARMIGTIVSDLADASIAAARFDLHGAGEGPATSAIEKGAHYVASKSTRLTGLHAMTNANIVTATKLGMEMLDWASSNVGGKRNASAVHELQRLGVGGDDVKPFAEYVRKSGGDIEQVVADSEKGNKQARQYLAAVNRFSDQVIMQPKASEKPYLAKNPYVSLAYSLQSYMQSFWYNVTKPSFQSAFKAAVGKEFSAAEKANLVGGPILTAAATYFLASTIVTPLRDLWSGKATAEDYEEKQEKAEEPYIGDVTRNDLRNWSQIQGFGLMDPAVNSMMAWRYNKTPGAGTLAGPVGDRVFAMGAKTAAHLQSDSDSNATKRAMYGSFYDGLVYPALVTGATRVPGGAGVAANFVAQRDELKRAWVDTLGGEKE